MISLVQQIEAPEPVVKHWAACDRGDWMLWWAGIYAGPPMSEGRRRLVLAVCGCARLALPHVADGETRPLAAVTQKVRVTLEVELEEKP